MDRHRLVHAAPALRAEVELSLVVGASPDELPPGFDALFDAAGGHCFFLGAAWFRAVLAQAMPAGAHARFLAVSVDGRPAAVLPLLSAGPRHLSGLTTPYTCLFRPILAPGLDAAAARRAGAAIGRHLRRWPVVRLDALPQDWPGRADFCRGLRRAGLLPLPFAHFGNWHEAVAGRSWDDYLAARPGALRETIRRKLARAARDPAVVLQVLDRPGAALEAGIAAFEQVYASSWKQPEPYPGINAALMRAAAEAGSLRLGVLRIAGAPAAAQFWLLEGIPGRATVLKLAHDEARRAASPGTVLTALMIRRLLEQEQVTELDFGRGDDPYKQGWVAQRRQRVGLLLAAPWRPAGLLAVARHAARPALRRLRGPAR
jgi:CelD/BcsL family acetyltransferase involved in cellulose biosynthesis